MTYNMKLTPKVGVDSLVFKSDRQPKIVEVDGQVFETVRLAAKFLKCSVCTVRNYAKSGKEFNGHKIKFIGVSTKNVSSYYKPKFTNEW